MGCTEWQGITSPRRKTEGYRSGHNGAVPKTAVPFKGHVSSNLTPSANLYTTSFSPRPASGGARQQSPKIRNLKIGGTFWLKSEPFFDENPEIDF